MVYSYKNFAASLAAVCLCSGVLFLSGCCDDCDDDFDDTTYVTTAPIYDFSYHTERVEAIQPMTAGAREYASRYSSEPGLYDFALRSDVLVYDFSLSGEQNASFALGVRPESDRSHLACDPCRGLAPFEVSAYDTSYDHSARMDRETSVGPGAENPDIYRERLDRSRYFSRDDVRDDNLDVDPTYGRGASVRDYRQFDVDMQARRDAQIYRDRGAMFRSRNYDIGRRARSTTTQPGYDTTRDSTSGAGAGTGSGGVSLREWWYETDAGDIDVYTDIQLGTGTNGAATPSARPPAATDAYGVGGLVGAGPSGTTIIESTGVPGAGTGGGGTKGRP